MRDASLTVYSDMIQVVETRGKRMKESESEQAGDGPPDETTLQEITERVTRRYPTADVGVMWVWPNGRNMYYFRWDDQTEQHAHVDRLDPEESRVLVAMAYSGLQAEKELLEE